MVNCWVVGTNGSGKTSLIQAVTGNRGSSTEVIDPATRKRLSIHLYEGNISEAPVNFSDFDCVFLLYDTTSLASFTCLPAFLSTFPANTLAFLIGTKIDLRELREVSIEEAENLALKGNCQHIEVSAVKFTNIESLVSTLRINLRRFQAKMKEKSQSLPVLPTSLLTLKVKLSAANTVSTPVFPGDTALDIAKRVLPSAPLPQLLTLSERITGVIEECLAALPAKALYKVRISYGDKVGDIVVREGDGSEALAREFCREQGLPVGVELSLYRLLESTATDYVLKKSTSS